MLKPGKPHQQILVQGYMKSIVQSEIKITGESGKSFFKLVFVPNKDPILFVDIST